VTRPWSGPIRRSVVMIAAINARVVWYPGVGSSGKRRPDGGGGGSARTASTSEERSTSLEYLSGLGEKVAGTGRRSARSAVRLRHASARCPLDEVVMGELPHDELEPRGGRLRVVSPAREGFPDERLRLRPGDLGAGGSGIGTHSQP